ncbi:MULTISPECIES: MarP family serine protease [Kitasatospora]|uniref:Putative peptidase S01 family protein n=1 Tax=Kitasatospora setae (strain ATCC 33774 / DSM 43861 / JCM 3304 / KCC A-0304 / NBRC 14216 / KM-6054) TaxID=452652 RepID=E4NDX7_KITSK|nr:MarP family serine protease [Kitasatospora setae]BAJ29408.1 putative peptidase S01 family protein [Kitasatospora setae KM-6054]
MNVLDLLLIAAALGFAVSGYRQGFVVGALSVLGFLGGGLVAVQLLPLLLRHLSPGTTASVVAVVVVIVLAAIGQAVTTHFGWKLRGRIGRGRVKTLDAVGGALVNVLSMLLVAWLIGSALAGTSLPTVSKQVRSSTVLGTVQEALPDSAPNWFSDLSQDLARNGFPQVFNPFEQEPITEVEPPDPELANSPGVLRAKGSLVKVLGTATACGKTLEGSGFVFAPHRVMTNAHVVGGVDEPTVQIGGTGQLYDATVVRYDWQRDIAVLDVPKLNAPPLSFAGEARSNDSAIVAGFPENGAFNVQPARVRGRIQANGPDIYHRGQVVRDVYSVRSLVRQGNSGGPLLTPDGQVYGVVFAKSLDSSDTGYVLTAAEVREDAVQGAGAAGKVSTEGCAL